MSSLDLRQRIADYTAENRIGGVLRITLQDRIIHAQSFGLADREAGIPFTEDSRFSFYSLSKPFCAMGLLKLCDAGGTSLDAHPGTYVPEAGGFDSRLTVRHLLHHVSGIPDFEQTPEFCKTHLPGSTHLVRKHLAELTAFPSRFAPGEGAMYANVNFVIAALIIENATGLSYADYMKREVFIPLGMETAVVDREGLEIPHRVQGYALSPEGFPQPVEKSYDWMFGAGDIVGRIEDAYALNHAVKHRLLLREDTWKMILTPHPNNKMGMGCTVSRWGEKTRITHNGGHTGFRTLHVHIPEDDFDIILLSNSGWGDARSDITAMIREHYYGSGSEPGIAMDTGYI